MENKKKKKSKKKLIIFGIIAVLFIGFVIFINNINSDDIEEDEEEFFLYKVSEQDLSQTVNAKGTISSDAVVSISTDLVGQQVSNVYVSVGDNVTKGQKIADIDTSDLSSELKELQTTVNEEKNELKSAYDSAVSSKNTFVSRNSETYEFAKKCVSDFTTDGCDDAYVSAKEAKEYIYTYEDSVFEMDSAINKAYQAMNSNSSNSSKISELKKLINGATIYAPSDGLLTSLSVNAGSIVEKNTIGVIQNADDYKVVVSISESSILKIKEGMKATLKVVATGKTKYTGTIIKVNKLPTTDNEGSVGYNAVISIDDKNTDLLIGMSASCSIVLEDNGTNLAVPYDALMTDSSGNSYVYKLIEDGNNYNLKYAYVETGVEANYYTEIKSGIEKGDLILITDTAYDNGVSLDKEEIDNNSSVLGGSND